MSKLNKNNTFESEMPRWITYKGVVEHINSHKSYDLCTRRASDEQGENIFCGNIANVINSKNCCVLADYRCTECEYYLSTVGTNLPFNERRYEECTWQECVTHKDKYPTSSFYEGSTIYKGNIEKKLDMSEIGPKWLPKQTLEQYFRDCPNIDICMYSPLRGEYTGSICADIAEGINRNTTLKKEDYRCRRHQYKIPLAERKNTTKADQLLNNFKVEAKLYKPRKIVSVSSWITPEEYLTLYSSKPHGYCSYSPPRGQYKTKVCGSAVSLHRNHDSYTLTSHRCSIHQGKKGNVKLLLETLTLSTQYCQLVKPILQSITSVPVVKYIPQISPVLPWSTADAYMNHLLSGNKLLCSYSPIKGGNTGKLCCATVDTISDNFWYNRCNKCYGKRGVGMDLLLTTCYNFLLGKTTPLSPKVSTSNEEKKAPLSASGDEEEPSSFEEEVSYRTQPIRTRSPSPSEELNVICNDSIQNLLGPTWYITNQFGSSMLLGVSDVIVTLYGEFLSCIDLEGDVTKEMLLNIKPITHSRFIGKEEIKVGDLALVRALLE